MVKFDYVHDVQNGYRKVLNSMARPGVVENLNEEASNIDSEIEAYKSTVFMMLMLLDREVTFNVISKDSEKISSIVSEMTYARIDTIEEADYVFITEDACNEKLHEVLRRVKIGDLSNPNQSSTIIAEFNEISEIGDIELTGPGIEESNSVYISGNRQWINGRRKINCEYPLGIDCIFLDRNNNVLCIPRTTNINI